MWIFWSNDVDRMRQFSKKIDFSFFERVFFSYLFIRELGHRAIGVARGNDVALGEAGDTK